MANRTSGKGTSVASFPHLFRPGQIGKVRLKNRVVMLPMGTAYASAVGEVTQKTIDHYEARARGGVGLVIVGYTSVMGREIPNGLQIDADWYTSGHCDLVETIHTSGAKAAIQLSLAGSRMNLACLEGRQLISSSAVARLYLGTMRYPEPKPLSREEIYDIIERWAQAARRAKQAGYDMIELHAAHGYLIAQFMSPYLNRRTDEFGGSFENRMRFPLELMKKVRGQVGKDYPIGFRISGDEFWEGGITLRDSPVIARALEEAGAAYINVSAGTLESNRTTFGIMRDEENWKLPLWEAIKKAVAIPVIAGGGLKTPGFCEKLLADGSADFVGLARPLLADPEWPNKARQGKITDIRPCLSCNECHPSPVRRVGQIAARRCTVNVVLGREKEFSHMLTAGVAKRVAVVGGGPGGMEAARVAALRGHEVTLYDRGKELGGGLLLASVPPGKSKWLGFRDYLTAQLKELGVKVILNTEVTPELIVKAGPAAVIVAVGAEPLIPGIPGAAGSKVIDAWSVLRGRITLNKKKVLVLGGGIVGCETAEFLAQANEVAIVELLPRLADDMEPLNRKGLLDRLDELKVRHSTEKRVVRIYDDGATVADMKTGTEERIFADQVVLAMGARAADHLSEAIGGKVPEVYVIGDCVMPRTVMNAVYEGALAAKQI